MGGLIASLVSSFRSGRSGQSYSASSLRPECGQGHAATVVTFADGERHSFVDDSLIDTSLTSELEARQQPPDSDLGAMAPLVAIS